MTTREEDDQVGYKISKLRGSEDYVTWRGDVRMIIRASDPELIGLEQEPSSNSAAARSAWRKAEAKAKAIIVLNLGPVVKVQVRQFIDPEDGEEKTARELWDHLKETYTATNAQAVQNVRNELDALQYDDGKNWDSHIDKFNGLVAKLATYGKNLTDEDKMAMITRSLPDSFAPITITLSSVGLGLTQFLAAIRSEVDRRKSKNGSTSNVLPGLPQAHAKAAQKHDGPFKGNCHYCGKPGHMQRHCRTRILEEARNNRGRGRYRGRGRDRGRWRDRGRGRQYNGYQGHEQGNQGEGNKKNQSTPWGGDNGGWGGNDNDNARQAYLAGVRDALKQSEAPPSAPKGPYRGFMAKLKAPASNIACLSVKKVDIAYIDSGATHHFFYGRYAFESYDTIDPIEVVYPRLSGKVL